MLECVDIVPQGQIFLTVMCCVSLAGESMMLTRLMERLTVLTLHLQKDSLSLSLSFFFKCISLLFFYVIASFNSSCVAASMSQVNIILRARSEKKKKKKIGRGREGERELECLCVTQRAREKQTERRKRKRERDIESGGCVFVSPPNQFSWGIYHQLQQEETSRKSGRRKTEAFTRAVIFSHHPV